ncbi:hypothetical protein BC826DRAFT_481103 [Russula brevipes]|nr:hypothetical protein BC826DRAFT_481103 [Russula brevipes]
MMLMASRPTDLSETNPLVELPHNASVITLFAVFSTGTHQGTTSSPYKPGLFHFVRSTDRPTVSPMLVKLPFGPVVEWHSATTAFSAAVFVVPPLSPIHAARYLSCR